MDATSAQHQARRLPSDAGEDAIAVRGTPDYRTGVEEVEELGVQDWMLRVGVQRNLRCTIACGRCSQRCASTELVLLHGVHDLVKE